MLEAAGVPLGRCDLFGAIAGGARLDDPACDLAVAAALASAAAGVPAPPASAFVGEIGLTGWCVPRPRSGRGLGGRAAGVEDGVRARRGASAGGSGSSRCGHVMQALTWAAVRGGWTAAAARRVAEGGRNGL